MSPRQLSRKGLPLKWWDKEDPSLSPERGMFTPWTLHWSLTAALRAIIAISCIVLASA